MGFLDWLFTGEVDSVEDCGKPMRIRPGDVWNTKTQQFEPPSCRNTAPPKAPAPRPKPSEGCRDVEVYEQWEYGGYIWQILVGEGTDPDWGIGITLRQGDDGIVVQQTWVPNKDCELFRESIETCRRAVEMWAEGKTPAEIDADINRPTHYHVTQSVPTRTCASWPNCECCPK